MSAQVPDSQLLSEVDDLLRTMPEKSTIRHDTAENLSWFGRVGAVLRRWDAIRAVNFDAALVRMHGDFARDAGRALNTITMLLHEARSDLLMRTSGPTTLAINVGRAFDYFDELRRVLERAQQDIFFVDPYLNAEFVSRYLPQVARNATVRLLAREKLSSLIPAAYAFSMQHGVTVHIRSAPGFHDRYRFVDHVECYQSGASFKDGAKKAPTTLTQITDAFAAMSKTYEDLWQQAKIEG